MTKISAINTAKLILYLLNKENSEDDFVEYTSRLKLLKLLYYVQGYHLAMFHTPLFDDRMEAWLHGPVVPSVYSWAKSETDEKINKDLLSSDEVKTLGLHNQQIKLIEQVLDIYNKYSAYGLRDKTHKELPWLEAYEANKNNEISQHSLQNFFTPLVSE